MNDEIKTVEALKKYIPEFESWEELDRLLISPRTPEVNQYIKEKIEEEKSMQMKWDRSKGRFVVTRSSRK